MAGICILVMQGKASARIVNEARLTLPNEKELSMMNLNVTSFGQNSYELGGSSSDRNIKLIGHFIIRNEDTGISSGPRFSFNFSKKLLK